MNFGFLQGEQSWDEKIARMAQAIRGRPDEEEEEYEEPEEVPAPRAQAPEEWAPRPASSWGAAAPPSLPEVEFFTASDLEALELPECRWAVPELLPAGLTLLGGKPKQGNSWLALTLACAVAGGQSFLEQPAETGTVLYLALDDHKRRLQARLDRLQAAGYAPSSRLVFATTWPALTQGGETLLEQWLLDQPDVRLVIVDTLACIRPPQRGRGLLYQEDYEVVRSLKRLADRHDLALLVVHHLRKQSADDEVDTFNGTTGLTGGADAVWVLDRPRGRSEATLSVTSRDLKWQKLALLFDAERCLWMLTGPAPEAPVSGRRREVLALLEHGPLAPRELAERLGIDRNAAKNLLHRMAGDGLVVAEDGYYRLTG
jgi:hypothetical protein